MNIKECEEDMCVYIKDAKDSVHELGGGSMMKEMVGSEGKIIRLSSTNRSVQVQSKLYGEWWFLPSDLRLIDEEVEPNLFHFDEAKL